MLPVGLRVSRQWIKLEGRDCWLWEQGRVMMVLRLLMSLTHSKDIYFVFPVEVIHATHVVSLQCYSRLTQSQTSLRGLQRSLGPLRFCLR